MQTRRFETLLITLVLMFVASLILTYMLNNLYLSSVNFLLAGLLIMLSEKISKEPLYIGPGTVFWIGHFICWMVGGYFFWLFVPEDQIAIVNFFEKWRFFLTVTTVGVGSFSVFYFFAKIFNRRRFANTLRKIDETRKQYYEKLSSGANWSNLYLVTVFLVAIVVLRNFLGSGSLLGHLINGAHRHVRFIVYALLGLAFLSTYRSRFYNFLVLLIFLAYSFDPVMRGGRAQISFLLFIYLVTFFARSVSRGEFPKFSRIIIIFLVLLVAISYFHLAGTYRSVRPGSAAIYSGEYSLDRMGDVFWRTVSEVDFTSTKFYTNAIAQLGFRAYEHKASNLIYRAHDFHPGAKNLFKEFAFQYLPRPIYPQKGLQRGKYLLRRVGVIDPGINHPITVPADAYYRFGAAGLVFVYGLYAFVLSWVSDFLISRFTSFGFFLYLFVLIAQVRMYVVDSLGLFTFFTYRLVIITGFSAMFFLVTNFLSREQIMRTFVRARKF